MSGGETPPRLPAGRRRYARARVLRSPVLHYWNPCRRLSRRMQRPRTVRLEPATTRAVDFQPSGVGSSNWRWFEITKVVSSAPFIIVNAGREFGAGLGVGESWVFSVTRTGVYDSVGTEISAGAQTSVWASPARLRAAAIFAC